MDHKEALSLVSAAASAARAIDEAVTAADRYRGRLDRLAAELADAEAVQAELEAAIDKARADADTAAAAAAAALDALTPEQQERVLADHAGKEFDRDTRLRTITERRAYKDNRTGGPRPDYVGAGIATAATATGTAAATGHENEGGA